MSLRFDCLTSYCVTINKMSCNACRCVLIELLDIDDIELQSIGNALANVLSIHYSLVSFERIHCLRLDFIDLANQTLLQFQAIQSDTIANICHTLKQLPKWRNNFVKLSSSIGGSIASANNLRNIELCLHHLVQKLPSNVDLFDITYITGRQECAVIRDICQTLQQIDVTKISKVNIFSINKTKSISNTSENSLEQLIPLNLKSLIESQAYVCNELTLEGYFKSWFHGFNHEKENIQIIFANNDTECIIKCDLKEAIIDVNGVSNMSSGDAIKSVSSILSTNCFNVAHNSIYKLRVCGLVDSNGLCESVVFGMPLFLSPTRCIGMNYELFEQNVQHFNALINVMINRKVFAIVELRQQSSVKAFFALLASIDKKSLIIKSIATRELVLPNSVDSIDMDILSTQPSPQAMASIEQQFNYFTHFNFYNPLYVQSDLYNYLIDVIQNNNNS